MHTTSQWLVLRYPSAAMLAVAAALALAGPSAADQHLTEGGSGTLHGTEDVLEETFVGSPCFFETTRSVYALQGVGTYHGVTGGGEEVIYRAEIAAGETLAADGPLEVEIESTQTYYHGPGGTHGTDDATGCPEGEVPVPAEFRIFAEGHVYRVGQPDQPCTGQGTFARGDMDDPENFVAEWTLDEDCVVVGNVEGFQGSGIAPAGTEHTATGVSEACGGQCTDNIRIDFVQFLAAPPDPGDDTVTIDDTVLTNGNRGQVRGTITCEAGTLFVVQLSLTQEGAGARGSARGTCTGSPQNFTIGFATTGPALTDGTAEACIAARTGQPGSRIVSDSTEVCEDVTVEVRS